MSTRRPPPTDGPPEAPRFAPPPRRGWAMAVKRVIDIVGASVGLVVSTPILVLAAAAVATTSSGPVLFRQARLGRSGVPFEMLKFRTMYDGASDASHRRQNEAELTGGGRLDGSVAFKDAGDPRITRTGRVLRRFSLDELPQLFNVLRGEMSLVGPRPSLAWEVDLFPAHVGTRFAVKPGITGEWQINGRNQWSMVEMLEFDCEYVDNFTLRRDLSILVRTVPAALRGEGAA